MDVRTRHGPAVHLEPEVPGAEAIRETLEEFAGPARALNSLSRIDRDRVFQAKLAALEAELQKQAARAAALAVTPLLVIGAIVYAGVWYFCTPQTQRVVEGALKGLTSSARSRGRRRSSSSGSGNGGASGGNGALSQ